MDPNHLPSLKLTNSSPLKIGFPKRKSIWVSTTHFFSGSKFIWVLLSVLAGFTQICFDMFTPDLLGSHDPIWLICAYFSHWGWWIQPTNQVRAPIGRFSRRPPGPLGDAPKPRKTGGQSPGWRDLHLWWWSWCTYGWGAFGANEIIMSPLGCCFFFLVRKPPRNVCVCVKCGFFSDVNKTTGEIL